MLLETENNTFWIVNVFKLNIYLKSMCLYVLYNQHTEHIQLKQFDRIKTKDIINNWGALKISKIGTDMRG